DMREARAHQSHWVWTGREAHPFVIRAQAFEPGHGEERRFRGVIRCLGLERTLEEILGVKVALDFPERIAAMLRKTIQRADFSQAAQFRFIQAQPSLEFIERLEGAALAFGNNLLSQLGTKSLHDTKAQPNRIIRFDRA